jgi:hypothetical protein
MSKIERGITFNFMRIDASKEPEFAAMFGDETPAIYVMNPGKRKRFLRHEGAISVADVTLTLDKILGGDAKFKPIKDNSLPTLLSVYSQYL